MPTVKWRPQALADLTDIESHYRGIAPQFGEALKRSILSRSRDLARFPRIGRIVPEIGDPAIRELIHQNYRIVYVVNDLGREVNVLTVFHSSRPLGNVEK